MANKIKNKIFLAALPYTLLQALPGEGGGTTITGGLSQYLGWLYKFALAAAAFLAVLMIVIGGVQMIVGGASETARSDGKKRIEQAIWGLLLAITAWLILYSINPDLVKTGLTIPDITIDAPVAVNVVDQSFFCIHSGQDIKKITITADTKRYATKDECIKGCSLIGSTECVQREQVGQSMPTGLSTWPPGPPPSGTYSHNDALKALGPLISTNHGGADCTDAQLMTAGCTNTGCAGKTIPPCTSLYGLPQSTISGLKELCTSGCVISGGTEPGHATHGPGKPIVDIRYDPSLISSLNSKQKSFDLSYICELGREELPCTDKRSDHFHVVFKK